MEDRDLFYDRQGSPIPVERWGELSEDRTYCRVGWDEIGEGVTVSTVWIGMNMSLSWDGRIRTFETMVFVELDEPVHALGIEIRHEGVETYRWTTEAEAIAGHDQVVAELRSQVAVPTEEEQHG